MLDSVDLNALLGSVDLDALLEGVDLNELLAGLDIDALMSNTELGGIIARSTSGVASEALDVVRSQGVGMDGFINRLVNRALGRDPAELPPGPPLLIDGRRALRPHPVSPAGPTTLTPTRPPRRRSRREPRSPRPTWETGSRATTPVPSRASPRSSSIRGSPPRCSLRPPVRWRGSSTSITDGRVSWTLSAGAGAVVYVAWLFVYYAYPWAVSGKTFGMALIGIRVVRADGSAVRPRGAALRTVALPLSFLTLGLGFLPILVGQHRRALHDRIAGTAVVYSWDARAAHLRFLARQGDDSEPTG